MLLRPNESICIQGAFFLSYAGGSKRAATWERVQRLGGSGSVFPKQNQRGQVCIRTEFHLVFFPFQIEAVSKERVEVESRTVTHSTLLFRAVPRIATFNFSARIEKKLRRVWHRGRGLQYRLCSGRVAAADVLTFE